jgi:hypothetical protein
MTDSRTDFDSPWKDSLETYFCDFITFFFPPIHSDIDWTRGYEFLDTELQQVVRDAELGKRLADKLAKVWRTNGDETWVLIHVEVQASEEPDFAERMFVYNYRLRDRYNRSIASLAVLGDERSSWRPNQFQTELWGCSTTFQFPIVKLLDYGQQWQVLERDINPFATAVMAHLKAQETRRDSQQRKVWKLNLTRRLYEQGYQRQDVLNLFRFIDWLMQLPEDLELEFRRDLEQLEQEGQMPYISSIEQRAIQKGKREEVESLLEVRFGEVDPDLLATIDQLMQLSASERARLILQLPREELIAHFQTKQTE